MLRSWETTGEKIYSVTCARKNLVSLEKYCSSLLFCVQESHIDEERDGTTLDKLETKWRRTDKHFLSELKIYLLLEDVFYSFCLLFVCGAGLEVGSALWLTVAVFLTKNPNLTLSKFWPAAPAEMRNSPLPTNGSFRLEIYVKQTLQHSPSEDVYSLCLHRIPKPEKKTRI